MTTRRAFLGTAGAVGAATLLGIAPASGDTERRDGSPPAGERQARAALLRVDTDTQKHYDALRSGVTAHLSPVIVVYNDFAGGLYTLVHDGERISEHPVPEVFQLAKAVAHAPLGIYSILAPYLDPRIPNLPNADHLDLHDLRTVAFEGPRSSGWVGPLEAFGNTLSTALGAVGSANLAPDLDAACRRILAASLLFIDRSAAAGSFDMRSFEDFSGSVRADIGTTMGWAANGQVEGVKDVMTRWRARVGEKDWADLYVVVMAIWTTSALNHNSIVLRQYMNQAKVDSHLIDLMMAQFPADPVDVALDNLARIVQDNVAAEMVFPLDQELADALKGQEDLLAPAIRRQLACPFHNGQKRVRAAAVHAEP
ncbi:hypothetical protein [Streptomyces sp. TLI_171]|uniref:hypothetical protein n=1 Tax=Streptomyces sp. TLI_171 TaxID=1938859 RepID=UPI000C191755|nr:hypothetical protein [Streptomyces sp. TLI_171]RKE23632.1 hypothetical protein BX266_7118 [Streptomyces sp. TLI_171]